MPRSGKAVAALRKVAVSIREVTYFVIVAVA